MRNMTMGRLNNTHTHQIRASTHGLTYCWWKSLATSPASACYLNGLSCAHSLQLQQFNYSWVRLIKHGEQCMAPITDQGSLRLQPCDNRDNKLKWLHKSTSGFRPELVSTMPVPSLSHQVNLQSKGTENSEYQPPQLEGLSAVYYNRGSIKVHSRT